MIKKINLPKKGLLSWENPTDIKTLSVSLKQNDISLCATDTLYGLLGNCTQYSYTKLKDLKADHSAKPFLLLIAKKSLGCFIDLNSLCSKLQTFISKVWPGPVTIIFKAKQHLPSFLASQEGTIALRCPNHSGLLQLLKTYDSLFSTSANKTGQPPPMYAEEIDPDLLQQVAYFVDTKNLLPRARKKPSTIIDCSKGDSIKVVRTGAYPIKELERYYDKPINH